MICSCHRVSERTIKRAIDHGATTVGDVTERCGAGGTCRGCHPRIADLIADHEAVPVAVGVPALAPSIA